MIANFSPTVTIKSAVSCKCDCTGVEDDSKLHTRKCRPKEHQS